MDTRQTIKDYVYYRNQMDLQRLISAFRSNNYNTMPRYNSGATSYPNYYSNGNFYNKTSTNGNCNTSFPWIPDINKILPYYNKYGQNYVPAVPKLKMIKPLTIGDDVQFKKFTGLNPNEMSFHNLLEYKMINPFTRQPWPQFVGKIKPEYNGISMMPTHYSLTPDMKRKMTFTIAEREGFRGYNQY